MAETPTIIVIGARSARQGIGEYVAGWFARHGARVAAIVGTTPDTVTLARARLRECYNIDCRGYVDVAEALAAEPSDIVAICSPYRLHARHLVAVGRSGRHCLCDKPLYWPAPAGNDPVLPFVASGCLLEVLTQWPCTLPMFFALYPHQAGATVERFEMGLSPTSTGLDMVPDAVPHFLSMVRALVGSGKTSNLSAEFVGADRRRLRLACEFTHASGCTRTTLHLATCPQRPRPAWYAVNGARVDREVDLGGYRQFFRADGCNIPLPDPLGLFVGRFLADVAANRSTDRPALDHDHEMLRVFYETARAASVGIGV